MQSGSRRFTYLVGVSLIASLAAAGEAAAQTGPAPQEGSPPVTQDPPVDQAQTGADEEMIFVAVRPVILTSIADVVTASDLLDRSLFLSLDPIPEGKRCTEEELFARFEAVRPRVAIPKIHLRPRMSRNRPEPRTPGISRLVPAMRFP